MPEVRKWSQVPASDIATSARSTDWCDRLYAHAHFPKRTMADAVCDFGITRPSYSQNIFDVPDPPKVGKDPIPTVRVYPVSPDAFPGNQSEFEPYATLRMPPGVHASTGNDKQFTLRYSDRDVSFWVALPPASNWLAAALSRPSQLLGYGPGFSPTKHWVAAAIETVRHDEAGNIGVRSPAAKMGLVVRPSDIAAGTITQPLMLGVSAQCSMTGPLAPSTIDDPDHPDIGVRYGCSASPASQCESRNTITAPERLAWMVPDGMRFRLDMTDVQVRTWVDDQGYTGATRATALVLAEALREFGFVVGFTTGNAKQGGPALFQFDGADPAAWKRLGARNDILQGLITRPRLRALRPPLATDANGRSSYRELRDAIRIEYR